jgi:hypothetical protein
VVDEELGPAAAAELGDSLSLAFLVVLESLGPLERAAFLLRDVFAFDYAQVAEALGRSEAACRQLVFLAAIGPKVLGTAPSVASWSGSVEVRQEVLNGEPGFVVRHDGRVTLAGTVEVVDGSIASIRWVLNLDKLHWVPGAT